VFTLFSDDIATAEKEIRADLSTEVHRVGQHKCSSKVKSISFAPYNAQYDGEQRKVDLFTCLFWKSNMC
jgi:hypothetical protein